MACSSSYEIRLLPAGFGRELLKLLFAKPAQIPDMPTDRDRRLVEQLFTSPAFVLFLDIDGFGSTGGDCGLHSKAQKFIFSINRNEDRHIKNKTKLYQYVTDKTR